MGYSTEIDGLDGVALVRNGHHCLSGGDVPGGDVLDARFLTEMRSAITAENDGLVIDWREWIAEEHPMQVQSVLGECLQRLWGSLLRTPLLVGDGGVHVYEPGYKLLVDISAHCMMLAAAVRLEVEKYNNSVDGHGCPVSEMMGGEA